MSEWHLIHSYTRKQALEDGVLVDVSAAARDLGFKVQVAVTGNLLDRYIVPPPGLDGQSTEGRLHDLLFVLHAVIKRSMSHATRLEIDVLFLIEPNKLEKIRLIAVIGPGDVGEPVLTIMLPEDD